MTLRSWPLHLSQPASLFSIQAYMHAFTYIYVMDIHMYIHAFLFSTLIFSLCSAYLVYDAHLPPNAPLSILNATADLMLPRVTLDSSIASSVNPTCPSHSSSWVGACHTIEAHPSPTLDTAIHCSSIFLVARSSHFSSRIFLSVPTVTH